MDAYIVVGKLLRLRNLLDCFQKTKYLLETVDTAICLSDLRGNARLPIIAHNATNYEKGLQWRNAATGS